MQISDLEQDEGDPLYQVCFMKIELMGNVVCASVMEGGYYSIIAVLFCLQTCIQWNEGTPEASIESDMGQMIANMNSGKLKGTLLINKEDKKVILNI